MDLGYTPQEIAFRDAVRTWLAANLPESLRRKVGSCAALIQTVHGVGYRFSPAAVAG